MSVHCAVRAAPCRDGPGWKLTCKYVQVGHALENDLAALRLVHTRVIDTGHLFPHPRVCPA